MNTVTEPNGILIYYVYLAAIAVFLIIFAFILFFVYKFKKASWDEETRDKKSEQYGYFAVIPILLLVVITTFSLMTTNFSVVQYTAKGTVESSNSFKPYRGPVYHKLKLEGTDERVNVQDGLHPGIGNSFEYNCISKGWKILKRNSVRCTVFLNPDVIKEKKAEIDEIQERYDEIMKEQEKE